MPKKPQTIGKLFVSTLYISAFTFGGGYVIVPLMKRRFVDELGWLEEAEMLDLAAMAQASPGAVAVNAAILVGYRTRGVLGAVVAALGTILPPLFILSVVSLFYAAFRQNPVVQAVLKGMMAGVAAVIFDVVLTMAQNIARRKKWLPLAIMAASFLAAYVAGVNVAYIILCCAVLGALVHWRDGKSGKEHI